MFDFLNELIEYDAKRRKNTSTAKSQFALTKALSEKSPATAFAGLGDE